MSTSILHSKIEKIPEEKIEEVSDFIDFIIQRTELKQETRQPIFGSGKGLITYMAEDFDEPLEDFKDYM
ncbi:MAG: DUF2281 domain-containing protein [Cyclobacteriaceae bacterium]